VQCLKTVCVRSLIQRGFSQDSFTEVNLHGNIKEPSVPVKIEYLSQRARSPSFIFCQFSSASPRLHTFLRPLRGFFAVLEKMQPTPQAVGVVQKIGAPVRAKEPYAERAQRFGAGYGRKKHPDPESEAIR
jgi:hypothetical protein